LRLSLAVLVAASLAAPGRSVAKKKPQETPASPTMTFEAEPEPNAQPPAAAEPKKSKKDKGAAAAAASAAKATIADTAPGGPASKTLDRAIKLYDGEDFYSASIELNKVVEGQTSDDEANRQRAEFYVGKTLYKLGV